MKENKLPSCKDHRLQNFAPDPAEGALKSSPKQNTPENRNCLKGVAKMRGDFGEVGMGGDGPELDPS